MEVVQQEVTNNWWSIFATNLENVVVDFKIKVIGLLCMVIKYIVLYILEHIFTGTSWITSFQRKEGLMV